MSLFGHHNREMEHHRNEPHNELHIDIHMGHNGIDLLRQHNHIMPHSHSRRETENLMHSGVLPRMDVFDMHIDFGHHNGGSDYAAHRRPAPEAPMTPYAPGAPASPRQPEALPPQPETPQTNSRSGIVFEPGRHGPALGRETTPGGFDMDKWSNPEYHSIKYDLMRNAYADGVIDQLNQGGTKQERQAIMANFIESQREVFAKDGIELLSVSGETFRYRDSNGGTYEVDTIGSIGAGGNQMRLQWGIDQIAL